MSLILKAKRDVSKEVAALVESYATKPKGTVITYEEIETVVKCKKDVYPWARILEKFRKQLADHHDRWCVTSNGVGLRFATDQERLKSESDRLEKGAVKRLNKAAKCLGGIADEHLTDEEQAFRQARLKQLADAKQMHKTHDVQRKSWLAAPQALPRITAK